MYVRLKHTLSFLALEMLHRAPRLRPIGWLLAYARLAPEGEAVPLARLRREAAQTGPTGARSLARLEVLGVFERSDNLVRLAPEYHAHSPYFVRQVERLGKALRTLDGARGRSAFRTPLERGVLLFNVGLFFECHEYLEDIWRAAPPRDRSLYHGIIQIAAAFYHFEKGNRHGARTLLAKALQKLDPCRPAHMNIDVDRLIKEMRPWMRRFASKKVGRPLLPEEFPTIPMVERRA